MSNELDSKTMSFLYNIQTRRRITPMYMIFTKTGLAYVIAGIIIFGYYKAGFVTLLLYFLVGRYIYNNSIKHRFYQVQQLDFIKLWINFVKNRVNTEKYQSLYDDILFKKPKLFATIQQLRRG